MEILLRDNLRRALPENLSNLYADMNYDTFRFATIFVERIRERERLQRRRAQRAAIELPELYRAESPESLPLSTTDTDINSSLLTTPLMLKRMTDQGGSSLTAGSLTLLLMLKIPSLPRLWQHPSMLRAPACDKATGTTALVWRLASLLPMPTH